MRAKELVPILSEQFGILPETGSVIDRSLATNGLRSRGLGRSWPEMTRKEAITFLVACLVAERPTKAAEEVTPWVTAKAKVCQEPLRREETEEGREEIAEAKLWEHELEPHEERPKVKFWKLLENYMAAKRDTKGVVGLVDYLAAICAMLEARLLEPERVKLDAIRSIARAIVTFTDENDEVLFTDTFDIPSPESKRSVVTKAEINLTASVNGHALQEILLRTKESVG